MFLRSAALTLLSLALGVVASLLLNRLTPLTTAYWPYGLAFLVAISLAYNYFFYRKRGSPDLTQLLIGGIVLRLLLSLILLGTAWFLMGGRFFPFAMHFLTHYVLFSVFEIRYLFLLLKSTSKQ